MLAFREDKGICYEVEDYGDGLKRIRRRGRSQGRCLFFPEVESKNSVLLVGLMFYKKETQKAPAQKIETARKAMREYRKE